jgi:hypothetical protein
MPDGDIIRQGLARRYNTPYKQVCEGVAPFEDIERQFAQKLLNMLRDQRGFRHGLIDLCSLLSFYHGSWEGCYQARDRVLKLADNKMDRRIRGIVEGAFSQCVQEAHGHIGQRNPDSLFRHLANELVQSEVVSAIVDRNEPHYVSADPAYVRKSLNTMSPRITRLVEQGLRKLTGMPKLAGGTSTRRTLRPTISADTDFSTLVSRDNETRNQPELPF